LRRACFDFERRKLFSELLHLLESCGDIAQHGGDAEYAPCIVAKWQDGKLDRVRDPSLRSAGTASMSLVPYRVWPERMVARYPVQCRCRKFSMMMMSSDRPKVSRSAYPNMRSAPWFQN